MKYRVLAIETSCDDTSVSIVSYGDGRFEVEQLLAYSQIQEHQQYGGVVPELASRLHSEKIIAILQTIGWGKISGVDSIAVTVEPGLPGSLVVGKTVANLLGAYLNKEVLPVHHIHGHLFSLLLGRDIEDLACPAVILTASGGHNDIYLVEQKEFAQSEYIGLYEQQMVADYVISKVGYTLDDAAGECFDKVSRMLGGPYPGGVWIAQKAAQGKENPLVSFKRIFLAHNSYEFSFSGMKSQVSFLLEKLKKEGIELTDALICDIAYEFQEAVVEVLSKKLVWAGEVFGAKTLGLAGGVSANERLQEAIRQLLTKKGSQITFLVPEKKVYSTDNGAMIGAAALITKKEKVK